MTIYMLMTSLKELANTLPAGVHSHVIAWVRVPNAGESAVLEITDIQQGFRETQGGTVATLCLDSRA